MGGYVGAGGGGGLYKGCGGDHPGGSLARASLRSPSPPSDTADKVPATMTKADHIEAQHEMMLQLFQLWDSLDLKITEAAASGTAIRVLDAGCGVYGNVDIHLGAIHFSRISRLFPAPHASWGVSSAPAPMLIGC